MVRRQAVDVGTRLVVDEVHVAEVAVERVPAQRVFGVLDGLEADRHLRHARLREGDGVVLVVVVAPDLAVTRAQALHQQGTALVGTTQLDGHHVGIAVVFHGEQVHQRVVNLLPCTTELGADGVGGVALVGIEVNASANVVRQLNEEALVRMDESASAHIRVGRATIDIGPIVGRLLTDYGMHRRCQFGLVLIEDGVARICHIVPNGVVVVGVGFGELVEVEVGLVGVTQQVVAMTRNRYACRIRGAITNLFVVQCAVALQQCLLARGGEVALARYHLRLVGVLDGLVLRRVHVVVARAVALEVDPMVIRLAVRVEVPLLVVVTHVFWKNGITVIGGEVKPIAVAREVAMLHVVLRVEAVVRHARRMAVVEFVSITVRVVDADGGVRQRSGNHMPVGRIRTHREVGRVHAVRTGRVVERDADVGLQRVVVDEGHMLVDVELGSRGAVVALH